MSAVWQVRTIEDWSSIRSDWDRIVEANPATTMFQSWNWIYGSIKNGLITDKTWLLAVEDEEGTVRGIAPLLIKQRGNKLRKVSAMGLDYTDAISCPADRQRTANAILEHLAANRSLWDIVDFRNIRADGVFASLMPEVPDGALPEFHDGKHRGGLRCRLHGLPASFCAHQQFPFIPLPPTWEEYTGSLSQKFSKQLQYDLRRIRREQIGVSIRTATRESIESDMKALFELHQGRWEARGKPGAFNGDREQAFHLLFAKQTLSASQGKFCQYVMEVEGKVVAALYCYRHGFTTSYYQSGFDDAFSKYSPMKSLIAQAIRESIEDGLSEFDMLAGTEDYKSRWGAIDRTTLRLIVSSGKISPSLSAEALRWSPVLKSKLRALRASVTTHHSRKPT